MKARIWYNSASGGVSGGHIVDLWEHSTAQAVFEGAPHCQSITYSMENGDGIRYERLSPNHSILEACERLVGKDAKRIEEFALLIGNLCPGWDQPGSDGKFDQGLFDEIIDHFGLTVM